MRNGRAPHQQFEPAELLFRRCDPDYITAEGAVLAEALRFPELSVVRAGGPTPPGQYEPNDARWISAEESTENGRVYFPEAAVLQFPVSAVPGTIERPAPAAPYTTEIEHAPYDDHYPHIHVHVLRDGIRLTGSEKTIKSAGRRVLRERIALLLSVAPQGDRPSST